MKMTATSQQPIQDKDVLASTIEAIPIGVIMINQTGCIELVNTELEKQFGYTRNELFGQPVEILLPESLRDKHPDKRNAYLSRPETRGMGYGRELFARRKDGSQFPVEIGLNPVSNGEGISVVATIADITHRKRLEKNCKNIIMSAPIGMLMVDQNAVICLANNHLLSVFGYQEDELIGQGLERLLPERYRGDHARLRHEFILNPESRLMGPGRDLTGLHKNGTELPVEIGLSPVETDAGTAILATVTNVAERKKMELNLRTANADLDEFTYVASHDLKSPLRGIADLLEWVEEDLAGVMTDDIKHNLDRVNLRIHRMEDLIDDLLNYARAGQHASAFVEINLAKLFENVIGLIEPPSTFQVDVTCDVESIQSPRAPLETVLRNLIANAINHHDRDDGQITITVTESDSNCIFTVCDDGPGIPQGAYERVFKIFQTLSKGSSTRSGVGLAVTKRLIEAHNGKIEIESADSKRGTCFRFWWPRFTRSDLNDR